MRTPIWSLSLPYFAESCSYTGGRGASGMMSVCPERDHELEIAAMTAGRCMFFAATANEEGGES